MARNISVHALSMIESSRPKRCCCQAASEHESRPCCRRATPPSAACPPRPDKELGIQPRSPQRHLTASPRARTFRNWPANDLFRPVLVLPMHARKHLSGPILEADAVLSFPINGFLPHAGVLGTFAESAEVSLYLLRTPGSTRDLASPETHIPVAECWEREGSVAEPLVCLSSTDPDAIDAMHSLPSLSPSLLHACSAQLPGG